MITRKLHLPAVLLSLAVVTPLHANAEEAWSGKMITDLLSQMTLDEKAMLTSGRDAWSTQPINRLGIPYIWMADGPHGLRRAPSTDT